MGTYAGLCFDEPEHGDVDVKIETLETAMGRKYKGPMVYEFDFVDVDATHEKLVWLPVCPLVDLPIKLFGTDLDQTTISGIWIQPIAQAEGR